MNLCNFVLEVVYLITIEIVIIVNTLKSHKMQEIIVISIALASLIYLFVKFFVKNKSHYCNKCGLADNEPKKD